MATGTLLNSNFPVTSFPGFTEAVQDVVGAMLAAGTGITVAYNDAANTLTVTATGGGGSTDTEIVRDTIGAALVAVAPLTVTVNDAADTITFGITGISADLVVDGTTNHTFTAADDTRLANTSGTNTGDNANSTGNSTTATRFATARAINGKNFDGTAPITIGAVDIPTTATGPIGVSTVQGALAFLAAIFPNFATQPMRFIGYGASIPASGTNVGDAYFVTGA